MDSKARKKARKKKINGQMMSSMLNNPDMFPQNGGPMAQPLRKKGAAPCQIRDEEERREVPLNRARFPLLNEDWVDKRRRSLVRKDDEGVYGGGGRSTGQQMGGNGNGNDVGGIKNASQEFPASGAASKAPFPMETELSQVSNDTGASDHLSTRPCNHKGQVSEEWRARCSLLNGGWVDERAQSLVRKDDKGVVCQPTVRASEPNKNKNKKRQRSEKQSCT